MTKIATRPELDRACAFMYAQLERGPIDWECKPWKSTRSTEQNALLFGGLYPPIADAMGYEVAAIHEFMLGTHFGWVDVKVPKTPRNPEGFESRPFRSTTRDENGKRKVLTKGEFSEFIATVERVAAKAGVFLPMEEV